MASYTYYLYPTSIIYYANKTTADIKDISNSIGGSDNYVTTFNGIPAWRISAIDTINGDNSGNASNINLLYYDTESLIFNSTPDVSGFPGYIYHLYPPMVIYFGLDEFGAQYLLGFSDYTVADISGIRRWWNGGGAPINGETGVPSPDNVLYIAGDQMVANDSIDVPEQGFIYPLFSPGILYYDTSAGINDSPTNILGKTDGYTIAYTDASGANINTLWRIGYTTNLSQDTSLTYGTGVSFDPSGQGIPFVYYLYKDGESPPGPAPCFLEGTMILCLVEGDDKYIPIETMRPGTLVKTISSGYKKVELIGKSKIHNPGDTERITKRLYKCSPANYPELTSDLYITGCHSILVNSITDVQRKKIVKQSGRVFVTDRKYRLMAWVDERAEPWTAEGDYTIWHFALEHPEERMNYGVYANGGLLVETCCIRTLRDKSGMTFMS
jgi:hypothetical protein